MGPHPWDYLRITENKMEGNYYNNREYRGCLGTMENIVETTSKS